MNKQDTAARITGAFAHELCNPLQGVRSLIDVIGRETARDTALNRKLERVEAGMERLASVVNAFRATYENLPRPVERVAANDLLALLALDLEHGGATAAVQSAMDAELFVYALAPELASLVTHSLLTTGMGHRSVEVTATEEGECLIVDCELAGMQDVAGGITTFEDGDGLAGIPVLIDELVRQCGGSAVFRYDDFSLISIRLSLQISR